MKEEIHALDSEFLVYDPDYLESLEWDLEKLGIDHVPYTGIPISLQTAKVRKKHRESCFFRELRPFVDWIRNNDVSVLWCFNVLAEAGTLESLGCPVRLMEMGSTYRVYLPTEDGAVELRDIQPLLKPCGFYSLADIGEHLGHPKLDRDVIRKYPPSSEKFEEYAKRDALITAEAVKWVRENVAGDLESVFTLGGLARDRIPYESRCQGSTEIEGEEYYDYPKVDVAIRQCQTAGRSEAFTTGFLEDVSYNDVKSLYPVACLVSEALNIVDLEEIDPSELKLSPELGKQEYGWLMGEFRTKSDFWGLPLRFNDRNLYVRGHSLGIFNTHDLACAEAEPVNVIRAWKPVFGETGGQEVVEKMFFDRVEGNLPKWKNTLYKFIMNSLYGSTSFADWQKVDWVNHLIYSAILATSHRIMKETVDSFGKVFYMDTDAFVTRERIGREKLAEYNGIPVIYETEVYGDMYLARSKLYYFEGKENYRDKMACHAWFYDTDDLRDIFLNQPERVETVMEKRATPKTREHILQDIPVGYWMKIKETLEHDDIHALLKGDGKRKREAYDSLKLIEDREYIESEAWYVSHEELMDFKETILEKNKDNQQVNAFTKMEVDLCL